MMSAMRTAALGALLLTAPQLKAAVGCSEPLSQRWCAPLMEAMERYEINTKRRKAAFLAQIAHESASLTRTREIWGPTRAQRHYEGRIDLGNIMPGDGSKYRGRGLIQITGRANYNEVGRALGIPAEERPELLEDDKWAALSAAWFWWRRGLNELADQGKFREITRRINGGSMGQEQRETFYQLAQQVFS